MRKNVIFILLISMIFSSCDLKTAEDYYNLAYELEEKGQYEKAIEFLDKAIEKKPDFRPALLNRGADKSEIGNFNGAIEDYEKILKFDPDNTLVLGNIGNNYKRLGLQEKAIEYYNRALETSGAVKNGSLQFALDFNKNFDKDIHYNVPDYHLYYERGISYSKDGKHLLAIKDLHEVLKYNYERANTLVWIGESYLAINDTTNAIQNLRESKELGILEAKELLEKLETK